MSDNKKLKSRRSSILKPPKPRNPLSDVDLHPSTDVTIKSRRVSFANVHFKKEFTADPEKNTIWHNSYEEEMNKSDKSDLSDRKTIQSVFNNEEDMNMSVQDMSLDSDVMNCTHLVNLDGSFDHNSSDSSGVINLTKHSDKEPILPTIPKESENICSAGKRQTINFIQGSEYANMDMTTVFPVEIFSQNKRNPLLYNQMFENEQNMEVTENIPFNLVQNNIITNRQTIHFNKDSENITPNLKENIKIGEHSSEKNTPAVQSIKDTDNRRTVYFHSGSMDITENISSNINQKTMQQSVLPENKPLTCKRFTILQHQINEEEQNMNIMENICAQMIAQQKSTVPNKENALRQTVFLNQLQNMELTQNICANFVQNNEKSKNRHTIHYNAGDMVNMDITEVEEQNKYMLSKEHLLLQHQMAVEKQSLDITEDISAKIQSNTLPKTQRQTILFKQLEDEEQNMEITQNITASVPRSLIKKINQQRIPIENKENMPSSSHRRTILYNQFENAHSMEITQNIPSNILQNNMKPKSREIINFTETDMGDMDFTEKNIPIEDKENVPSLIFDREEQSIEITQKNYPSCEKIHFNKPDMENLDITESVPFISIKKQKLPVENKENICGTSQIKSVLQNETKKAVVEKTESIQRDILNIKVKDRQTIHFNDSDSGAIDITKSVPFNLIQKMAQQKLTVENKENIHSTSHTKFSYNETQVEENMEVTKNITANIVRSSPKQRKRQTINFNESNMGSLDITENVPSNVVRKMIPPVKSEHIQNICTNFVSNSNNKESTCNISEIKSVSRNEAQKEIVEITESIRSDIQNIKLKDRQTIHFDDSSGAIDITKSVPFSLIKKLGQQKLPVEDEENMHSTSHTKLSYNDTQEEQNIEVTKNITTNIVQNSQKQKNRQTIHFNESNMENMNVTENAAAQKIIQPVPSEYTQHICTNFISNSENHSKIHYNETEMDHIEITENVPANLLHKFMQQLPFEDKEEQNECLINVTDALELTPVNNQPSFNITANLTSLVDSTEKLINCKIGLPTSEYSKIIIDNIDKNYSIVNTSIPENLNFSDVTVSDNGQKIDSIISVNSSIESVEHVDEWKKMLNKVKPPPEIHYFDFDKLPPLSLDEGDELRQSWVPCSLNIKERMKKYLNIDLDKYEKMKQETINFNVPQRQLEEENPNAIFDRVKKLLEHKRQSSEFQKELTLVDKIKRMATKDKLWYLLPNTEFNFIFMKNIRFDVEMETNSEIVRKFCSILDESKLSPIGLYVFEKLKPKLKEEKIKSCIGVHYTIFSFLDYLTQISEGFMNNINDLNDLIYKYGLTVDEDLNATLLFTNISLPLAFEIKFNLNDLDHITADSIKINHLVCTADENALKRLVKFCPTDLEFIRAYHRSVSDYLKILQQSKLK